MKRKLICSGPVAGSLFLVDKEMIRSMKRVDK